MLKDKKISIVKLGEGTDEDGFPIEAIVPIPNGANIWAYYRHATGKEFYQASQVNAKEEVIFVINYRSDIDTTMQIEYKSELYNITRIDDFEGYKEDLKIYAYKVN